MTAEKTGQDFIEHYGVKGMRWGVRRSQAQLARARKKEEKKASKAKSEDKQRHDANRKRGKDALSDKELKKLVERMNTENQFNKLNPSVAKKGHNQVKALLGVTATITTAYNFANSPAGKAIGGGLGAKSSNRGAIAKAVGTIGDVEKNR